MKQSIKIIQGVAVKARDTGLIVDAGLWKYPAARTWLLGRVRSYSPDTADALAQRLSEVVDCDLTAFELARTALEESLDERAARELARLAPTGERLEIAEARREQGGRDDRD